MDKIQNLAHPVPQTTEASGEAYFTEDKPPAKVEASQHDADREKARFMELRKQMTGWQWVLFHAIVFFGAALSGYHVSNVATIQVSIFKSFGHISLLPWVVTTFSMGNAATSPLLNQIMRIVDLKWFTLACWTLFFVASAAVGASPTMTGVIVGRTLLGVSGAGVYLALLTYITILSKPKEHARVNGLLAMGFATGLIMGPIIGGAFAENHDATWRWAFYICLPYTGVIMLLIFIVCPNVRLVPQRDIGKGLREIDWVGAFLHVSTLVLFDAACIFSGSTLSWHSGATALWVVTGVVVILYAIQQSFSLFTEPSRRILPIAVLSTRVGFLVMVCTFVSCASYAVALYYLPLYYAFTRNDDSIQTAVHILPYICLYIAGAIFTGGILPKLRRYALLYLVGGLLIAAGSGSLQSVTKNTSLGQSMGLSALLGFGVGSTSQLGASVLVMKLPEEIRMDSSITMAVTVYSGITWALAIAGCIFENVGYTFLSEALNGASLSNTEVRQALAGFASPVWARLSAEYVEAGIAAITSVIIREFYITIAAGAVMVACSLFMSWEALDFKTAKGKETTDEERIVQES